MVLAVWDRCSFEGTGVWVYTAQSCATVADEQLWLLRCCHCTIHHCATQICRGPIGGCDCFLGVIKVSRWGVLEVRPAQRSILPAPFQVCSVWNSDVGLLARNVSSAHITACVAATIVVQMRCGCLQQSLFVLLVIQPPLIVKAIRRGPGKDLCQMTLMRPTRCF